TARVGRTQQLRVLLQERLEGFLSFGVRVEQLFELAKQLRVSLPRFDMRVDGAPAPVGKVSSHDSRQQVTFCLSDSPVHFPVFGVESAVYLDAVPPPRQVAYTPCNERLDAADPTRLSRRKEFAE